jgi:hypothetical protein
MAFRLELEALDPNEVSYRGACILCAGGDNADCRKHSLNAMVELGNQHALVFLTPPLGRASADTATDGAIHRSVLACYCHPAGKHPIQRG